MAKHSFLRVAFGFIFIVTISTADDSLSFPEDFLFGTASSAYQIEGAWNESGKTESVWDQWTHDHPNKISDGSNSDVTCDSYHKYKEDIKLLKDMKVDLYRFSVSWTRILPNGYANVINEEGLNYYKNLINELLANGIEPFVTLYHWDHPAVFENMGGWTNEMMVEWLCDYARIVFKELGPKVKYFMTINEPNILCQEAYIDGAKPPGKEKDYPAQYLCLHNMLKAHAKIYHMYDKEFRKQQKGEIGIVTSCLAAFPKNPSDSEAVDVLFQFSCGWVSNPIFSKTGDYPAIMKDRIAESSKVNGYPRSILPEFSPEWVQYIKGTSDFFGLNHYTSTLVETVPRKQGEPWYDYFGLKLSVDPSWPTGNVDWLKVVPVGLRQIIEKISIEYDYPDIFITENGFPTGCGTYDYSRIFFLHSYMKEMLIAMLESGCKVKGYTIWTLLDNFEWEDGYATRFGLIEVNFSDPNRTRTPRLSLEWYKRVIETKKLSIDGPVYPCND